MSIRDLIKDACNRERLFYLYPKYPIHLVDRSIFVTPEVNDLIKGNDADHQWRIRGDELHADMDRFTRGGRIVATLSERNRSALWKRLQNPEEEVWEIKSHSEPTLRVFGRFAEKDTFIAIIWAMREHLKDDNDWNHYKQIVKTEWNNLFPTHEPFSGDQLDDYISGARKI